MNKGAYLEDYLEEKELRYIEGCDEIKELKNRLHNIKGKIFQPPYGLQAKLREYQKDGYNWFRTLDYLGFGGILGDEMGLGKNASNYNNVAFQARFKNSYSSSNFTNI